MFKLVGFGFDKSTMLLNTFSFNCVVLSSFFSYSIRQEKLYCFKSFTFFWIQVHIGFYSVGLGPIPWVIMSEVTMYL